MTEINFKKLFISISWVKQYLNGFRESTGAATKLETVSADLLQHILFVELVFLPYFDVNVPKSLKHINAVLIQKLQTLSHLTLSTGKNEPDFPL